jgi:hypothetical protein
MMGESAPRLDEHMPLGPVRSGRRYNPRHAELHLPHGQSVFHAHGLDSPASVTPSTLIKPRQKGQR